MISRFFPANKIKVIKLAGKYFLVRTLIALCPTPIAAVNPLAPGQHASLDWKTLPGIGPKLVATIETGRQKNGDSEEFFPLQRANGNGPKKLEECQDYFTEKTVGRKINNLAKTNN